MKNYTQYLLFILLSFFAVNTTAATVPISIYSPDFSSTYVDNWTLNGNSTVVNDALRLTDDLTYQSATAFWTAEICNADGFKFSAFFSFLIDKSDSQADGITFILQQYSNTFGSDGEGIGYADLPGKSIAVEYDTYQNSNQSDPDNGHIALDINGVVNHDDNATTFGVPKNDILVRKFDLAMMGIDLADHDVKYTWIDYDGTNLQVRISTSPARPADPIIDIEFDLESYFDGSSTFFGFGSATGAAREKHYINSVYIHNRYAPIDISENTYEQGDFASSSVTTDTICEGESYLFNGIEFTTDTVYTVNLTNSVGCDSTATLILDVRPLLTTWTGAVSCEWFNDDNWDPKFPVACTDVIIPDVGDGVLYPTITSPAECHYITFEPGGAVLGLKDLDYERAYVQMDLERSKWYTLTAPLKEMYSGDYYFTGAPRAYMRLFDDVNPDIEGDTVAVGTWTQTFANNTVNLEPGMGYAFLVDSLSFNYPNAVTYSNENKLVSFPREDSIGNLITTVVPFSGLTGKLYPKLADTLPKDSAYVYRFAMENDDNELEDIRVNIKEGLNLIGNPLMTHLDFVALYASNEDKISEKVKFWNGTSFTTYMAGSGISSSMDMTYTSIPPMQSFFVDGLVGISEDTQLEINLEEHFIADETTKLRKAKSDKGVKIPVLKMRTTMSGLNSYAAIAYKDEADNSYSDEDAFKLFSQYRDVPEVYTLADGKALDINFFGSLPYTVPVGIKTDKTGVIQLDFAGADQFDDNIAVSLINTKTGEQKDLRSVSTYKLEYDGDPTENYLFIEFSSDSNIDDNEGDECGSGKCIQVYAKDKSSIVVASPETDKIEKVIVWEQEGNQLYNKGDINNSGHEAFISTKSKVCVIRVQTEKRTRVIKVLME